MQGKEGSGPHASWLPALIFMCSVCSTAPDVRPGGHLLAEQLPCGDQASWSVC